MSGTDIANTATRYAPPGLSDEPWSTVPPILLRICSAMSGTNVESSAPSTAHPSLYAAPRRPRYPGSPATCLRARYALSPISLCSLYEISAVSLCIRCVFSLFAPMYRLQRAKHKLVLAQHHQSICMCVAMQGANAALRLGGPRWISRPEATLSRMCKVRTDITCGASLPCDVWFRRQISICKVECGTDISQLAMRCRILSPPTCFQVRGAISGTHENDANSRSSLQLTQLWLCTSKQEPAPHACKTSSSRGPLSAYARYAMPGTGISNSAVVPTLSAYAAAKRCAALTSRMLLPETWYCCARRRRRTSLESARPIQSHRTGISCAATSVLPSQKTLNIDARGCYVWHYLSEHTYRSRSYASMTYGAHAACAEPAS
eukprot:2353990-Rhodomonas_salina.3